MDGESEVADLAVVVVTLCTIVTMPSVTSVTRHMLLLSALSSTPHRGDTLSHVAVRRTEGQSIFESLMISTILLLMFIRSAFLFWKTTFS